MVLAYFIGAGTRMVPGLEAQKNEVNLVWKYAPEKLISDFEFEKSVFVRKYFEKNGNMW